MPSESFVISDQQIGQTLAAVVRARLPGQSWTQVRNLIARRMVTIGGDLCLDPARRLKEGELVELLDRPGSRLPDTETVVLRYRDADLVVVEKPSGIPTVRHPAEREWTMQRRSLAPTLEDLVQRRLVQEEGRARRGPMPHLRIVQRLDKETSGLVVFARSVAAERGLGKQFHEHTVTRRYLALIPGYMTPQRIASVLVRDRGDGRRGTTPIAGGTGKEAITHIDVAERLPVHTLLTCRLETGRTHQIRIHLAERGHPVCGEKVYNRKRSGEVIPDASGAPRLALHAAELGLVHPVSGEALHWEMPLPSDLRQLVDRLRGRRAGDESPPS
jgi:23S rRNA pseudouridine1911/1915/1917 synthase